MKLRRRNTYGSLILSLCLLQSAQADLFDVNGTTAGFGVADLGSYNWLASGVWSDGALAANDAGTATTVTWQGTASVSEQAYFIGAGANTNYTVRLGATGATDVYIQNLAINVNAAASGALAGAAGNVTIGNAGDTANLIIRAANSVGAHAGGTLTINNGVNLNGFTMNYRGGNTVINGVVSGSGSSKIAFGSGAFGLSAGTLTLANTDNTYAGRAASDFISANYTLEVTKLANGGLSSSIGTSSANIGINGGTLRFIGSTGAHSTNLGLNIGSANATLSADGVTSADTITITGAPTYTAANAARTIILSGANLGNNTMGFAYGDNGTGANVLTKSGAGRWIVNQSNTYTGATNANGGTLVAANVGAFGVAGRTINFNTGTVDFATDTSANAYVLNVGSGNTGTVVVNRATSGVNMTHAMGTATLGNGTLNIQQGSNVTGVGTLEFAGITLSAGVTGLSTGAMLNPTSGRVLVSGAITRSGSQANLLTLDGTTTGNLISGVISGVQALTKSNTSEWELSNANTFTGNTRVTGGKLILTNNLALQNSAFDTSGAGTLDFSTLTTPTFGGLTSASNFALHSTVTSLTLNVAGTVSYTGNLSGGVSGLTLTKSGAGTQTLGGTNSYTGLTTVNGGELRITNSGAIGGSNVTVTSGQLTLDGSVTITGKSITTSGNGTNFIGGLQSVSGINTWAGNVILGADNSRVGARLGATLILSGAVDDGVNSFNFVVRNGNTTNTNGGGNATTITEISGVNTYGGSTIFIAGLTRLGTGNNRLPTGTVMQFGLAGANAKFDMNGFNQEVAGLAVTSASNDASRDWNANELTNSSDTLSTLTVNTATSQTFGVTASAFTGSGNYSGIITGNIALVKTGSSSLTLTATNSYTGGTRVDAGILALSHATNTLSDTGAVNVNGGELALAANSDTVGAVTLSSGSITSTTGTLTGSSYDVRSGSISARLAGTGVTLTKSTSGTVALTGTNTYTGATNVDAGKLVISSTGSTAAGSAVTVSNAGSEIVVDGTLGGALTINSGAILSGSGTISGSTTIAGIHNAGNSPGIQTFAGDLGYQAGSTVNWELGGNTTTQALPAIFDQIVVGGNLNFAATTTLNLLFNTAGSSVDWSNALWDSNQSWTLFDVAGTTTGLENVALTTSNWADSNGALFNTVRNGSFFTLSLSGQDVLLNYTAVPETSVSLLGGLSALLLLRRKRR